MFGTPRTLYGSFTFMAVLSLIIGVWAEDRWVVIAAVVASGIVIGLNNTLVTTAVMSVAPVPRPTASATYGFVRFVGGGLAPFCAGKLVEHSNVHVPFIIGALAVAVGALVLSSGHDALTAADAEEAHPGASIQRRDAEQAVFEVPGIEEEAILAAEAIHDDARYNHSEMRRRD
jgi:ACDE family multidrug resistance protein